uniref:ATP synthase complex subunit 8 n=1 Tax=Cyema atrum TaxID=556252 RepID=D1YUE2_9TELE|nr:ATP synthase F0 subunit 8 [Cyema atrum]BAI53526.1 ATPase subunit 8 [Cyema atrum]
MPQLNPSPWFMILVFSWTMFLIIIPIKVIAHMFNNEPNQQTISPLSSNTWNWPWH